MWFDWETWLDNSVTDWELFPGYSIYGRDRAGQKKCTLFDCQCIFSTKVLNGYTIFYVSYWIWDCHFTWSSEPREGLAGLAACSAKVVPSFLKHWVLVRPRESNPRPFALHSNALPTKLTLGRLGRVGRQVLVTIKTGLHWGLSPFGSWEREHCTDRGWNWNAEVYVCDLVNFLSSVSVWFLMRDFRLIELFSSRQRWVKSYWFGKRCIYPLLTNPRIVYFLSWLVIIFSCSS